MANLRADPVGYRPFRANPILQEGQLGIARDDGALQARVAAGYERLAAQAGGVADQLAMQEGAAAGRAAAAAGAPGESTITGGIETGYADLDEGELPPITPTGAGSGLTGRAKQIRDGLVKRGLTPLMAAAAAGHGRQESALRADGPNGDNGTSSGIWQWRNERRSALQAFARRRGKNWRDPEIQMDFFVHELKTSETTAWRDLQAATTMEGAVTALMHFERPQGYTRQNPRGGHGYANRLAYARWASALGGAPDMPASGAAAAIEEAAPAGGASAPIRVASLDPGAVTPGQAGSFRPTSNLTIRGRAFNEAGTRDYLNRLDAVMRREVGEVYDRFGDDPEVLDQRLKDLRTVHMRGHVFPEIEADYDIAYERLTQPYRRQARDAARARMEAIDRAAFMDRTAELETEQARMVAGFDPADDEAATAILGAQDAIDRHYDDAVSRGILSPEDAARNKAVSRREAATRYYLRQGEGRTVGEIGEMRTRMREDFAAGRLDGVDAGGFDAIDAGLEQLSRQREAADKIARSDLTTRGEALASAALYGAPDQAEVSRFLDETRQIEGGEAVAKSALDRIAAAQSIRDRSLSGAETYVRELERNPEAVQSGTAKFARDAYTRLSRLARTDPIAAAEQQGTIPLQPMIFDGETDVAASIGNRIAVAETVAGQFGVAPRYLKAGEAKMLGDLAGVDPDRAIAIAADIVSGAGSKAPAVLAEISADAPALTQAGVILAGGGSDIAARDVVRGHARTDGRAAGQVLDASKRAAAATDVLGGAFATSPSDGRRTIEAAHAIARARVAAAGVDPKSDDATAIFSQALQEASGARFVGGVQWGGVVEHRTGGFLGFGATRTKIVVPSSIRADRFSDVVEAIRDEDLQASGGGAPAYLSAAPVREDGRPYTAAELKAGIPVAVRGGYRFAYGDPASDDPQWLRGADGRPLVVDLEGMRDRLEARVPGAFQ